MVIFEKYLSIFLISRKFSSIKASFEFILVNLHQKQVKKSYVDIKDNEKFTIIYDVHQKDPNKNDILTYTAHELPEGMRMDPKTGRLRWEPTMNELDFHKLVTSLKANALRIESILKSIKKLKPKVNFEFFTWCDEFTDFVQNLQFIKKEVGFYETQHMAWLKGEKGIEGDYHFSSDMNERFASYLIKKYPNHFNTKLI